MEAYLGDIVKTGKYGYIGRVTGKDHRYEGDRKWMKGQEITVTKEEKAEPWYHLLCNGAGAVLVSERDIAEILPPTTPYENATWGAFYFRPNKNE